MYEEGSVQYRTRVYSLLLVVEGVLVCWSLDCEYRRAVGSSVGQLLFLWAWTELMPPGGVEEASRGTALTLAVAAVDVETAGGGSSGGFVISASGVILLILVVPFVVVVVVVVCGVVWSPGNHTKLNWLHCTIVWTRITKCMRILMHAGHDALQRV